MAYLVTKNLRREAPARSLLFFFPSSSSSSSLLLFFIMAPRTRTPRSAASLFLPSFLPTKIANLGTDRGRTSDFSSPPIQLSHRLKKRKERKLRIIHHGQGYTFRYPRDSSAIIVRNERSNYLSRTYTRHAHSATSRTRLYTLYIVHAESS